MNASLDELLDRLGSTPDEVAESLATAGITGKLAEPCECAIARYATSLGFKGAMVTEDDNEFTIEAVDPDDEDNEADAFIVGPNSPVGVFIRQFDAGQYPHLIAGGA